MAAIIHQIGQEVSNIAEATSYKNASKLAKYGVQWGQILSEAFNAHPASAPSLRAVSACITTLSTFEAISDTTSLFSTSWQYIQDPSWEAFAETISDTSSFMTSLPDISAWGELSGTFPGFMSYTPLSLAVSCAGIYSSGTGIYEAYNKLDEGIPVHVAGARSPLQMHQESLNRKLTVAEHERGEITLDAARNNLYMKIAKNICYIAISIFTILSTLQFYSVHQTVSLGVKSVALISSIAAAYLASTVTLQ